MGEKYGTPVTWQELEAASSKAPDPYYDRTLIFMALAQILERLERIEQQQQSFECRGGRCVYE